LQQASREFGVHREILERRRRAKSLEPGEDGMFSTGQIAEMVFGDNAAQAALELTVARKQQIDLDMQVTRRDRIPLDVVEQINDTALGNVAGLLKSHRGKALDDTLINDIFTELRGVGAAIKVAS